MNDIRADGGEGGGARTVVMPNQRFFKIVSFRFPLFLKILNIFVYETKFRIELKHFL
jgi:hypothetical protein